jgi:DNA-binding LytR/AlgR family response regulator
MISIAIVEDEEQEVARLKGYITQFAKERGEACNVEFVGNGMDFISDYKCIYDIVLMDIEMPYLNGMEAAKKLRLLDQDVVILFVTNMAQYAIEGYAVDALDFMVKPVEYFNFKIKLQKAIDYVKSHCDRKLILKPRNSMCRISIRDIMYVEVLGHNLIYHLREDEITVRGQLTKLEEELEPYNFSRCNDCLLINLRQVTGLSTGYVSVGEYKLPISRRRKKTFLEALNNYLGGGM